MMTKIILKSILSFGLSYLFECVVKSKWFHFKLLALFKKYALKTDNSVDDCIAQVLELALKKHHKQLPMNETDIAILDTVLKAMSNNEAIKNFNRDEYVAMRIKLELE